MTIIKRLAAIVVIAVGTVGTMAMVDTSANAATRSLRVTPRPLTCHSLHTGTPFEKLYGVRAVVKGQQYCTAHGSIIPSSVCLQDSKTGYNYWHNAACKARSAYSRGRMLTVSIRCSPVYFRTVSTYTDRGATVTSTTGVVRMGCR